MASTVVRAHGHTRSTQSFVYTMVSVWKRPSLMALEILWRWSAGVPILACVAYWGVRHWAVLHAQFELLSGETLFKPVAAVAALQGVLGTLWALSEPALVWFVPVALLVWAAAGAFGKNMVARRMDPETKAVATTLFPLRLLRLLGIVLCIVLWAAVMRWTQMGTLARPASQGGEPNVVMFLSVMIVVSLTLFVGWALTSWPLELAQTLAMRYGYSAVRALREAVGLRKLRGEVMEVNLVLCIVRIALLVLLLVFSACPLPFENVETTTFLVSWCCGVGVWYLCMSDFFHAVRLAAYAALESADRELRLERFDRRAPNVPQGLKPAFFRAHMARLKPCPFKTTCKQSERNKHASRVSRSWECASDFPLLQILTTETNAMSFGLYTLGTIILIAGVIYVCSLAHMPTHWTAAIAIVLLGAGIMGAVSSTRSKDPN